MHRRFIVTLRFILLTLLLSGLAFPPQNRASAASSLTVSPLTWNIIGLDSNSPTSGPYRFPVAARACNPASNAVTMSDVEADFVWLSGGTTNDDSVILLRPGSLDTIAPNPQINLVPGSCYDFYFEAEINRSAPSPYNQTRRYRIDVTYDDPDIAGIQTVSTTTPRELFVEHLISQSRNAITNVELNGASIPAGGTMTLMVGNTYTIKLYGGTATQGYNQFEAFINFPNTIFQVLSVNTTYSANDSPYVGSPNDKLYADACKWENDPNSPNYRACVGGDYKAGGSNVVTTYTIKIIGGGGTTQTLNTLLYDFSGSSYHYNADYSTGVRFASIVDPANVTMTKSFSPNSTNVNGVSALTITLSNPNSGAITGYNFTDPLPANMTVANPPNATTTSCGTPTFSPVAGANSISFSNGTIAANGSCTVKVNVTTSTTGSFLNTTNHLFVDSLDTGKFATSTLTVNTTPPSPAPPSTCTSPVELAVWNMDGASVPPLYTNKAADVAAYPTTAASYATVSGTSFMGSIGSPAHTAWGGTAPNGGNGWSETASSMNNYFQFVVDTSNYGGVYVTFDVGLFPNGDWANPKSNVYVSTSANGGAFSAPIAPFPQAEKGAWITGLTKTAASTGTSTTTFRFGVDGAGKPTAEFYLDTVRFMGCERLDPPTITKTFVQNPIAVGGTSTLTFTLSNPNADALSGLSFTDTLPSGLTLASVPTTSCGSPVTGTIGGTTINLTGGSLSGTVAVTNGSTTVTGTGTSFLNQLAAGRIVIINSVSYTVATIASNTSLTLSSAYAGTTASGLTVSGQLAGGGSCIVTATVTSSAAGAYQNVSGFVSSSNGGTNTGSTGSASASLSVIKPPSIAKLFSSNPILPGGTSTLTFTITNPNQNDSLSGVTFTDTFPTSPGAMTVASPLVATTSPGCGSGTLVDNSGGTLAAGDPGIRLTGATIAGGNSCTVKVNVTVPSTPTSGSYVNTNGAVSSTNGGTGNTATDTLNVNPPHPAISLYKQVGSSASGPWSTYLGVTIPGSVYYKFTVENIGDVPLTSISVTDPTLGALGCSWPASLAVPSATSDSHISSCVVGPIAATSSSLTNTATASGTYNGTTYQSNLFSATYASQALTIVKSVTETSFSAAGDVLHYSYVVTNSGSAPLLGPVDVTDNKAIVTCPGVTAAVVGVNPGDGDNYLDSGESLTCTATYTILAADVTAGFITNTASATVGGVNSSTVSKTVYAPADLAITKNNGVTSVNAGGTTIYTIRVMNGGPSGVTGAILSDPAVVGLTKTAVACSSTPGKCSTAPNVAQLEDGSFALPALANGEYYEITVAAIVDVSSGSVTNTATVTPPTGGNDSVPGNNSASDTDTVTTPADLTVTKTNNTANGWVTSGGTFQWIITARNGLTAGTATFASGDTILTDTLPAGQTYGTVSVTNGSPAPTGTINCSITGTTLTCVASGGPVTLPANASFSVAFNVMSAGTANLSNTATVDPGSKVSESNESNNSGSNTVYVFDAQPSKLLIATSESSTSASRVTIGEMVRYRLAARIPEGDFANFQLVDNIPSGLQFVNDGTARFTFVSNSGISSSTLTCTNDTGGAFDLSSLPSANVDCLLTGAISGGGGNGAAVTFSLGDLSNADADANAEYVVVEFNALVLNVNTSAEINQGVDNQTGISNNNFRPNNATLKVNNIIVGNNSANITVNISEPAITDIAKSVSPGPYTPGGGVTYTLTFSNTSGVNAVPAFDIVLTDTLNANLTPGAVNVSSTQTGSCIGGTPFTTSNSTSGQAITVNVSCLDPNKSVTVTIGATIKASATGGSNISNTGNVTYTSLPGSQGSCSTAPFTCTGVGASGSGTGERNGLGGTGADGSVLNNYSDSGSASLTVQAGTITIEKQTLPDGSTQSFTFTPTYNGGTTFNLTDDGTNAAGNLAPGTYTVVESAVTGWSLTGLSCIGDTDNGSTLTLGTGIAHIDLDSTENIICTFISTKLPILTLQKMVVNDNGGTAVDTDWTLSATQGGTTISGVEGNAAITNAIVSIGTWMLSESGGSTGYTASTWSCSGAADADLNDGLTLAAGEDVTCTITNDDNVPTITAVDDTVTTPANTPITTVLTTNDTNSGGSIDLGSVNITVQPSAGTGMVSCTGASCQYTPPAGYVGITTYTYQVCLAAPNAAICDTAIVTVTVTPTINAVDDNYSPSPIDGGAGGTTASVIGNDMTNGVAAVIGTNVTLTSGTAPSPTTGSITMNADGTITVAAGTTAGTYTYPYTICTNPATTPTTCDTAMATIIVAAVNDVPVANDDSFNGTEDTAFNGDLKPNNGSGVDVPSGDGGNVWSKLTDATNGTATVNTDGTFTYTPNANFYGIDSFIYRICDGSTPPDCDNATVTITVASVNDVPVANDDTPADVAEDSGTVNIVILGNDTFGGDGPSSGTITITTGPGAAGTATVNDGGTLNNPSDDRIAFTPAANYNGPVSISYEICDSNGDCDPAVVTFNVTPVNDVPMANNDSFNATEDTALNGDLKPDYGSGADVPSGDGGNVWTKLTNPGNGTVTVNADGTFTYNPNANFNGTDSFTYRICDGSAPADCDDATVTITVASVNDLPTATNNEGSVDATTPTHTNNMVTGNEGNGVDSDPDADILTVTEIDGITNPAINLTGTYGTLDWATDGSYTYTLNTSDPDYLALARGTTTTDTFTYTISDGNGGTATAEIIITITGGNHPPVATNNEGSADAVTPMHTNNMVTGNESNGVDSDADSDTLTVTGIDGVVDPASDLTGIYGTLNWAADGSYTYTLNTSDPDYLALAAGATATDTFTYTISDGKGGTATADIIITITGGNHPPVATNNEGSVDAGTPAHTNNMVTGNEGHGLDSDADSDSLTVTQIGTETNPAIDVTGVYGSLNWAADGSYTYTLNTSDPDYLALTGGATVTDTFPYTISDGNGGTATANIIITITRSNAPFIGIAKDLVSSSEVSPGTWELTYNFRVMNYGNTALNGLQVSDNLGNTFPSPNSFSVQSKSATGLTINTNFNGSTDTNLLTGVDSLAVGASGTITVVVRVVPMSAGPFNNTAVASGQCPSCTTPVTDNSQTGTDPDPDNDNNPTNNNAPTPVTFGPNLFDPPFGIKVFDATGLPLLQWTMVWINDSNIVAVNAQVSDPIPSGTTYAASGAPSGFPLPAGAPAGSTAVGVTCTDTSSSTSTTYCYYEGPTATYTRGRIVWVGTLGPDLGATDAASANNEITITFNVNVDTGVTSVQNTATIDADADGNTIFVASEQNVASAARTWTAQTESTSTTTATLPATGFAPNVVTDMSNVPMQAYTATDGVTVEIPSLNIKIPVVGVPKKDGSWNVSWLGNQAGWLEGSAFPSWNGNSVLTGHVYLSNGLPGPFVNLGNLKYGDKIIIHAYGQKYTFEVRTNDIVQANDTSVMKHEEKPWLTLVTCKEYDEKTNTYRKRVVVRAVLVNVTAD